ncbi:MAG: tryptophan--tRNA ligase [Candidatus Omnitrophica bacterium]|nr:tryptophan--tRNA ligase [Candidatus Omnitrophota bacterium]MBD3268678.1 tryptophan--tRNA ligase [Candidatus Omnitrophota bacterium]
MKKVILSGMRPTGKLHLGHWVGALSNWVELQKNYKCFFMIADWHALMSEYKNASSIKENTFDNVCDWLSYGIDPESSVIFSQSEVEEHLQLFMIFASLTPLGWLSRCPTFKEQVKQLKEKDINTYAFLGYPALQAADIVLYRADFVPVGEDQIPHLELCREIARRFHSIYKKDIFKEPQPLLTQIPRFMGLDGRKMSKSYNNYISLDEEDSELERKISEMFTDPQRKKRKDPGRPHLCNIFNYYSIFSPGEKEQVDRECRNAARGCTDCKKRLIQIMKEFVSPRRRKKKELMRKKDYVAGILQDGKNKAKEAASSTMQRVREAMKF